jgi:hypothetical protein
MRTAKCLIIVLVLAAVTAAASQAASNTRIAHCIVRITADPDIVPLNTQTVTHLVLGSAVAGKAAQDVLGLQGDAVQKVIDHNIQIEWLSQSIRTVGREPAPNRSRSAGQSRDEGYNQMMQQLRGIYGDRYMQVIESSDEQGNDTKPTEPSERGQSRSSRPGEKPERGTSSRSDAPGMMMGGDMMGGGGMGGGMMGGGGMGGGMMGGGGMGGAMMGGGGMGGGMMGGGGMGGGMMGSGGMGMGGMMRGMGGMYGGPAQSAPGVQHTATLTLSVHLADDVKPAAEELLKALVKHLRQTLLRAYDAYAEELMTATVYAEMRRDEAKENLDIAMGLRSPPVRQINDRLETIVDLSILTPEMPFAEAIEHLKNAVTPPLPIVVMWKELLDSCEIEPTTPIDMDGLPHVRLDSALRAVLEAVSGTNSDISYQVDNDVIIIREEESQTTQAMPTGLSVGVDLRDLMADRRSLARDLRQLEMDLATAEARQGAIEDQMNRIRYEAERRIKEDSVAREIQKLIDMNQARVNRFDGKPPTVGSLADEFAQAQENLVQARISLARRREELGNSAGGGQLNEFNNELSRMAIDAVEKKVQVELIRRQLAETEDEIARASMFDPRAARIQTAREALHIAEAQITRLKTRLARLQPSTVTVIGAN